MEETTNVAISDEVVETSPNVTEESTTSNDVTSNEAETTDTSTTDDSTETKVETENQDGGEDATTPNWEKNYKEVQGAYTKVTQELAQLKKELEQKKSVVAPTGQIKDEFVQRAAQQLAMEELNAYRQSIFELDSEVQAEVNNLLNLYQNTGNKNYLDQAKEYYGSNFVGRIEANKYARSQELANQLESQRKEYQTKVKQEFEDGLKTSAPTAFAYQNKDSKFYCPELESAINGAIGNASPIDVENAIKNIEAKVIEKYKAGLAKVETAQNGVKGLVPPANKMQQQTTADKPLSEITDEKELSAVMDKYID